MSDCPPFDEADAHEDAIASVRASDVHRARALMSWCASLQSNCAIVLVEAWARSPSIL
jgi:hypothetical protein